MPTLLVGLPAAKACRMMHALKPLNYTHSVSYDDYKNAAVWFDSSEICCLDQGWNASTPRCGRVDKGGVLGLHHSHHGNVSLAGPCKVHHPRSGDTLL